MTTDEFLGSDFAGTGVFAFDKAKMIAGDAAASYIYFDLASPTTIRLGGLLPVVCTMCQIREAFAGVSQARPLVENELEYVA